MGEQNVGDLEVVRKSVEAWIQNALPDRPGLRIAELRFPESSGESSVTLLLEASWEGGGAAKFALRMVPAQSEVFESHDLRLQCDMMEIMRAEGVPVPPVLGYEPDASLLGSDFYVMDFVEGRIPPDKPPMVFGSWVADELGPEQRAAMWEHGLETLAAIHRIDPGRHEIGRLPRAGEGEPVVAQELRMYDSLFTPALRARAAPELLAGFAYLVENPPESEQRRLCWGDSRVGNVIWRDLRPVAVIDWELANLADPLSDLTWWVWIDKCNSEGLGATRMSGVPEAGAIYERWRELTGLSIRHVSYFELLTVVRYAIVLELKFQAMRAVHPDTGDIPNFSVQFIPELLEAARRAGAT